MNEFCQIVLPNMKYEYTEDDIPLLESLYKEQQKFNRDPWWIYEYLDAFIVYIILFIVTAIVLTKRDNED